MSNPRCPVTGEPAVRFVQWVKARFLIDFWRIAFGVNARPSFGGINRFGLWLSPTGLHFFDPMIEGDHEFYNKLYARMFDCCLWHEDAIREEFRLVAGVIKQGDRVLDVGCGFGSFRRVIPHAHYTGLDPHFAEGSNIEGIFNQTLGEHLARNAGTYDAVCAFQVIEHVKAPVELFADMVRAARPGGLVIAGVPQVPSALTRFPNQLLNAPPHHLTWWTSDALTALARRCGASVVNIEHVPWGDLDALIYWMARFSPIRCRDVFYRNRVSWHASAIFGFLCARLVCTLGRAPKTTDEGSGLLLVARRDG